MLIKNGGNMLKKFSEETYKKQMIQVTDNVYHMVGYGHSNAIVIEGLETLILIDTLDSNERSRKMMEEFRQATKSNKPIKTIIYTHGHPDHRGGAGAHKETVEEIIAFSSKRPELKHMNKIQEVLKKRTIRQFGYELSDEEAISQGIGIREGHCVEDGGYDFLPATTIYSEEKVSRKIDGISLELVSAPGETDDTGFVWLPQEKILCCGDNYYGCWPNLYAIRGGQYRDIATWIDSLTKIIEYQAEAVLPGHTLPLLGSDNVTEVLSNFRDAIQEVLNQTLDAMNKELTLDETVKKVQLPEKYQALPYLTEFYGTIEWTVKAIYTGYLGWFDGNPTNLYKMPAKEYSQKMLRLLGTEEKIFLEIEEAMMKEDYQWALELSELLLYSENNQEFGKIFKARILYKIAEMDTSANGRHYLMACAKDLLK